MDYYEAKDLIGKTVYDTSGQKIGEVNKAVFLKDGRGALLLKNTSQVILIEAVRKSADIILVDQTEASTNIPTEDIAPRSSLSLVESTPPMRIEPTRSELQSYAGSDSTLPFDKMSMNAFLQALKSVSNAHSQISARNTALSELMKTNTYRGLNELLAYLNKSFIPHERIEEQSLFPVILQRQPGKALLVKELSEEHSWIDDVYMQLQREIGSGRILESRRLVQDLLTRMNDHYRREESLFHEVMKEYGSA